MKVPLNVSVHCTDGRYGRSTHIIIDSTTRRVTHIVVNKRRASEKGRLVPVKWVKDTTPELILLNRTKSDVEQLESFLKTEYIEKNFRRFDHEPQLALLWPHIESNKRVIDEKKLQIPDDVGVIRKGARVRAKDGSVGVVDEFIVDDENGNISHLIMMAGGLIREKKKISIPVSRIDNFEKRTVFLNLDKKEVMALSKPRK